MLKYFLILGSAQLLIWMVAPKAHAEGYLNIKVKRAPAATQPYKSTDIIGDEMPQITVAKKQFAGWKEVRVKGQ